MMFETFRNLSQREQMLLSILAGVVGLAVLFYGIVSPTLSFRQESVRAFADAKRLEAITANLEAPGEVPQDNRGLRSIVTGLADRREIVYTRINQGASGDIEIDLEGVPYDAFFSWLEELEATQNITVSSALVTPGEGAGAIEARLTLTRSES